MSKLEKITIRNTKSQDFESIFLLLEQLWPDKKLSKTALKKVFKRLLNSPQEESFCAEIDDQIIGFCTLAIRNSLWQESRIGYICELVVDTPSRGKKIGTTLTKKAIHIAKKKGCKRIELDSAFDRKKAHNFYKKIGFTNRAYVFSKTL